MSIIPVILAGGSGQRLWPLSKLDYPKQFVSINGGAESLFQQAVLRVGDAKRFGKPIIVCNEEHRFIVSEQLRAIEREADIMLEPIACNTAPAIMLAALQVQATRTERVMLVMPSDHLIENTEAFFRVIDAGKPWAEKGKLVTFGITPQSPEVGYGYIKSGAALGEGIFSIAGFTEKPSRAVAEDYLKTGGYAWNSGIFLLSADTVVTEMAQHNPPLAAAVGKAYAGKKLSEDFLRPDKDALTKSPSISFDYALMEHTPNGAVIPVDMGWCDLGSWTSLHSISDKDAQGNAVSGNTILQNTSGCYIRSHNSLIAAIGLKDLVIVAADEAVLIASKAEIGDIKTMMKTMDELGMPDMKLMSFSHRPWGRFYGIDQGEGYQVKKLYLKPGGKISLQTHEQRAEHWVVVNGVATVTNGDNVFRLEANESTYIPAGTMHRLENRETDDLIVIEVQTGAYLGEDDIKRYEDIYQRS